MIVSEILVGLGLLNISLFFNTNNQFYFERISLACVHSLIVKNISI